MSFKRWLKAEADVADVLMNVMVLMRLQIFHVDVEEIHKKSMIVHEFIWQNIITFSKIAMASHFTARAHQVLYKIVQNAYLCQKPFNYCFLFFFFRTESLSFCRHTYLQHAIITYYILYCMNQLYSCSCHGNTLFSTNLYSSLIPLIVFETLPFSSGDIHRPIKYIFKSTKTKWITWKSLQK